MAFCSKCGTQVNEGAAFCAACGSPVAVTGAPVIPPPLAEAAGSSLSSNVAAALSYFFITAIIFLVIDQFRQDRFVRFHSFQSIAFGVVVTIFWIVWNGILFGGILSAGFFWAFISLINTLISLAIFVYWVFLVYKAFNKETYKIPVIGEWAAKQAAL